MTSASVTRQLTQQQQSLTAAWLDEQTSENTRNAYRIDLDAFGRWCASNGSLPLTADATTLVAFQTAREAVGDSPATIRRRWSALTSFYDFAVRSDAASINPAVGASRPPLAPGNPSTTLRLTPEAVAGYRSLAASLDPRLEALVALLVVDGLKMGEALALDVTDVGGRPPRNTVTVRRRGESKRVVLDADSSRAVRRCAAKRASGPLFVSESSATKSGHRRLTRFGADHLMRQLNTDGTEARVTANALRKFHIATAADAADEFDDADLERVRSRAGLADVRSVRRYRSDS